MSDFDKDINVPANDCISRQAAIDAVHEEFDECLVWDESGEYTADEVERILDRVPSVEKYVPVTNAGIRAAETKKGRWIVEHGVFMHDGIYGDMYHCSVCGYRERNPEGFNYCPNCGAKMSEIPTDSESEDKE